MDHQSSKWDVVLEALRAAGVPEALGMGVIAILADAKFGTCVPSSISGQKPYRAFSPVDQLEAALRARMGVEQSCAKRCARQDGYSYARLAALQKARLWKDDA